MREILFRGKSYTDNEWHYGYFFYQFSTPVCPERYEITDGAGLGWNCPEETIGQFTGLTDKNGKKIFEGDILAGSFDYEKIIGHVIYGSDATFFIQREGLYGIGLNNAQDWVEVVGNIHDSPELLGARE